MHPSLPNPASNLSHWHRTTRSFPHLNANRFAEVPSSAKYVVIGSGITGAATAWELINSGVAGEDILILEAREAVSGATGQNAGHVRPDAFRGFPRFSAIHGTEQAKLILENEKLHLQSVKDFVETHNINCDFNYTTTIEVCMTEEYASHLAKVLSQYRKAGGDVSHIKFYQGDEAKAKTKVPAAISAYEWPAASNHPGKLTQWVLSDVISKGGKLWTHCPATKISKHQGADGARWDIQTPRGIIAAETVIHCTNAYAGYLLPEISGVVTPRRAQAHSYVPPASFSGESALKSTRSLRYGPTNFFSVNQLKDGTVIMGGQAVRSDAERTPEYLKGRVSFDDTTHNPQIMKNSIEEFSRLTASSSNGPTRPGEGFSYVWTGIVGETPDAVPFVGALPGLDGQWICTGYNGHGMARIFQCVPGLVKLINGCHTVFTLGLFPIDVVY
ncbi:unnamed protein product [Clonostachys byssicola]|uniref:FAD dependent oxidoreductase domain-containing protein n=1 Tax=Clonostachys byssicola TaxID=160290 RepID=A0A9N9Y6F1_9HYPO|nr:unnamed protein product [Clonostachys byssicola]